MSNTLTIHSKKRVSLNKRSSLLLDYQNMLQENTNNYTRQLVASALQLPTDFYKSEIELPRLLKSSLRTHKSAPCSPTKSVQFDSKNLENICYFKKAQTPLTISRRKNIFWDSEEEEEVVELLFPNWPNSRLADVIDKRNKVIRIEKSSLEVKDNVLIGKVLVRNLDYHKTVTIRYTFDCWDTVHNVQAIYTHNYPLDKMYDVFTFTIDLSSNSLYFAVQYKVGSQEFWDNNDSKNYEIQSVNNKKEKLVEKLKTRYDFSVNTIDIPRRHHSKPSSPTGSLCHSPLATSPSMEVNSPSYIDLVSKYCFYSSSPTRSPMSTY